MKPKSAKAKGRRLAKETKALILMLFPELTPDDVIVASSGQTGEDLIFSARARGLLPISIECKNVEALLTTKGWAALEQAEANSKDWPPIVVFRKNRIESKSIIDTAELFALLKIRALYERNESLGEGKGIQNGN